MTSTLRGVPEAGAAAVVGAFGASDALAATCLFPIHKPPSATTRALMIPIQRACFCISLSYLTFIMATRAGLFSNVYNNYRAFVYVMIILVLAAIGIYIYTKVFR